MERHDAWQILTEYTKTDSLRKHALSVEAVMQQAAREYGGDPAVWGTVGMLHDFDYEIHPNEATHPMLGEPILREHGVSDEIRHAVLCHAPYSGAVPVSDLDKMILACDELTGFVVACTLVQPNRSLSELKIASVKKKLKDKAFARAVHRDEIYAGAQDLGVELDEHIQTVIESLQRSAPELGLEGAPVAQLS